MILQQHYLYRGYQQIAALDLMRSNAPALWLLHWDPTQPVATRPLSLRKNGTWYTYGHDLTKNVTELYKADGTIATAYDYTPYGTVTASGIDQPIQWSSEHYDPELALVYYNYRHYNPLDGRWINRDPINTVIINTPYSRNYNYIQFNLYMYSNNNAIRLFDYMGMVSLTDCQRILNKAKTKPVSFSRGIATLMKQINSKRKCRLTSIRCVCTNDAKKWGGFNPHIRNNMYQRNGYIEFYANNIPDIETLIGVLQHELVHAWQNCQTDRNVEIAQLGSCQASICRELAAYRESGYCQRNNPGNVRLCVIQGAANSATTHCMSEYPTLDKAQAYNFALNLAANSYENCAKKYYPNLYNE